MAFQGLFTSYVNVGTYAVWIWGRGGGTILDSLHVCSAWRKYSEISVLGIKACWSVRVWLLEKEADNPLCPELASYPGSLIIAGEEKRAWFQSLAHALNLTC